jgi:hypothetical protein
MAVIEHKRLSNVTLGHKLKYKSSAFIGFLHFTVTVGSLTLSMTHTLKWLPNDPSLLLSSILYFLHLILNKSITLYSVATELNRLI